MNPLHEQLYAATATESYKPPPPLDDLKNIKYEVVQNHKNEL